MQLLEEELHPLRRELEERPTLRLLLETLTSTLSLFSNYRNGSASLLQSSSLMCFEVRNGLRLTGGGNLDKWRTSPSFQGRNLPSQCSSYVKRAGHASPSQWSKKLGKNRTQDAWSGAKPESGPLNWSRKRKHPRLSRQPGNRPSASEPRAATSPARRSAPARTRLVPSRTNPAAPLGGLPLSAPACAWLRRVCARRPPTARLVAAPVLSRVVIAQRLDADVMTTQ
jgi:hypothetical protein